MPDTVRAKLDYEKIGQEIREGEGGVFVNEGFGYVAQESELVEAFQHLDLTPKHPDYMALVEIGIMDTGNTLMLKLPASSGEMREVLHEIGVAAWAEVSYRVADCRIPALCDTITQADDITAADAMARKLAELTDEQVSMYKAVLSARGVADLSDAMNLIAQLDDYLLSPTISTYEEMAIEQLTMLLDGKEVECLLPHLNVWGYGRDIAEQANLILTVYGAIERKDRQPIQKITAENTPAVGGMEMM